MIKKIAVKELQIGMRIERFDGGWLEHPFIFSRRTIKNEAEIARIREWGITHVYIEDGQDVEPEPAKPPPPPVVLERAAPEPGRIDWELKHVPISHELVHARKVREQATQAAKGIMASIQAGEKLETKEAEAAVKEMDDSLVHNKDALLLLMRLRKKDEYTFEHSVSVGVLLMAFARAMGFDQEATRNIGLGGLLHDVGKMAVPLGILNKPGALSEEEFRQIQQHVVKARKILLANHHMPPSVLQVAMEHHERFDGTGYPRGLTGEAISLGGRMASIVDVFDALTADRCYHKGLEQVEVLRKLYGWSKSHFDDGLVQLFIKCIGIYPPGTLVKLESGMLGVVVESTDKLLRPVVRLVYDTTQDWAVPQKDIDLSKPLDQGGSGDRIVGYESAKLWRINPLKVLGLS